MSIRISVRVMVAGVVLLLAGASLQAQTNYSYQKASARMTAGAWVEGGISFDPNVEITEEAFTPELGFAFRASASVTYPFTSSIFGTLNLGLDSRSGIHRSSKNDDIRHGVKLSYFSIFPAVRFSAFILGVNIGLPMSGTSISRLDSSLPETEVDIESVGGKLNTMIEPRIGAILTLMDEQSGWLGLSIMAGYPVNNLVESVFDDINIISPVVTVTTETRETHIPTVQLGLTYQFAIPGTGL
jgi:hypothetical protein